MALVKADRYPISKLFLSPVQRLTIRQVDKYFLQLNFWHWRPFQAHLVMTYPYHHLVMIPTCKSVSRQKRVARTAY